MDVQIVTQTDNEHFATEEDRIAFQNNAGAFRVGIDEAERLSYYETWAQRYEQDINLRVYHGPAITASYVDKYMGTDRSSRVLDVAAGTGHVGVLLKERGFVNIDAVEPSPAMVEEARGKNVYSNIICEGFGKNETSLQSDMYDCAASCGGFGSGHMSHLHLEEFVRVVKPGGLICNVMREEYLNELQELEPFHKKLEEQGLWTCVERVTVPGYYYGKSGLVFVYRVL